MNILKKIINHICNRYYRYKYYKSLDLTGKNIIFKGNPLVLKHSEAKIKIGDNTLINSCNHGYHVNMFSRCKLYADTKNSIIEIGKNCRIHGTCIHSQNKISIGNNVLIAANTQIMDSNGHSNNMTNPVERLNSRDEGKEIIIEDNVWIGTGSIILGGTKIGEGSILSAGSVAKGILKPNSIYRGNPAQLVQQYKIH